MHSLVVSIPLTPKEIHVTPTPLSDRTTALPHPLSPISQASPLPSHNHALTTSSLIDNLPCTTLISSPLLSPPRLPVHRNRVTNHHAVSQAHQTEIIINTHANATSSVADSTTTTSRNRKTNPHCNAVPHPTHPRRHSHSLTTPGPVNPQH